MRPVDIVLQLLQTVDPEEQAAIVREAWKRDVTEFWIGLEMATGAAYDFGLKGAPYIDDEDDGDAGDFTFSDFYDIAIKLAHGELRARDADAVVYQAAGVCNITEWNHWYRRILLKNLHQVLPMQLIKDTLIELTTE